DVTRGQIGNHYRPDKRNTREKNEGIILNATRLLLALALHPVPIWSWTLEDYKEFNQRYAKSGQGSILPLRADTSVTVLNLRRDAILPPIPRMIEEGWIELEAVYRLSTNLIEEQNIVWKTS